jgi:hypothetical protein
MLFVKINCILAIMQNNFEHLKHKSDKPLRITLPPQTRVLVEEERERQYQLNGRKPPHLDIVNDCTKKQLAQYAEKEATP